MHEFALAEDIIVTIEQKVHKDLCQISVIHIDVGTFSGVVVESLEFGLRLIAEEKGLKQIQFKINEVTATAKCECGETYDILDIYEECPACRSLNRVMVSGSDVMIKSVELDEKSGEHQDCGRK